MASVLVGLLYCTIVVADTLSFFRIRRFSAATATAAAATAAAAATSAVAAGTAVAAALDSCWYELLLLLLLHNAPLIMIILKSRTFVKVRSAL